MSDPGRILKSEERATENARDGRVHEAHAIRTRLPAYVRVAPVPELVRRVSHPELLPAVRAWVWGSPSLLLLGRTKLGKSTAAALLFRALLGRAVRDGGDGWDRADSLRWFGAEHLGMARREHPFGQGDAPEILQACAASLLFIDDAGWDRDPTVVSEILDARYERGLPTIVTTGKTGEELHRHYGGPVLRRLLEAGGNPAVVVDCFEPSSGQASRGTAR
jgi:hypothetical protein